jgi:hypothetical protein
MFKKNTAVAYFPIGKFFSSADGSEVTTGTPTGAYTKDGAEAALSGTIAYKATGKEWGITGLTAAEMNGDTIGLNFNLAGCQGIHFTIKTVSKLVSDLVDLTALAVRNEMDANSTQLAGITSTVTAHTGTLSGIGAQLGALIGYVDTEILAIKAKTDALTLDGSGRVTVGSNADKSGYSLSESGLDAVQVETGVNIRQAMSICYAESAGTLDGTTANTIIFCAPGTTTERIRATVDEDGNRTSTTVTLPA